MTPRVPISRCKKCPHYRGYCPMEDLEPCVMHKELTPLQIFLRIVGIEAAILAIAILVILLVGCSRHEEKQEYHHSAVELLRKQRNELSEWNKLIMAIALTESKFNPKAQGSAGDTGILQITPIYVKEINRLHDTDYSINDAFDIKKSIEMYELMQSYYNPNKDKELAIALHNRGENYKKAVLNNMAIIENYELIRKNLK